MCRAPLVATQHVKPPRSAKEPPQPRQSNRATTTRDAREPEQGARRRTGHKIPSQIPSQPQNTPSPRAEPPEAPPPLYSTRANRAREAHEPEQSARCRTGQNRWGCQGAVEGATYHRASRRRAEPRKRPVAHAELPCDAGTYLERLETALGRVRGTATSPHFTSQGC